MAVPFLSAGTAHRLCRAARISASAARIPFEVTGWMFGKEIACEVWRG